jgi:predicted lipid-binding transport protein (Tim44 family)
MMNGLSLRVAALALASVAVVAAGVSVAEARAGRGFSSGSRGARTFQAPPPTPTAPRPVAPVERSMTQPGQPGLGQPGLGQSMPRAQAAVPAAQSRFGGGLMGGLLGAGLLGALLGYGFFGGLGGLASLFGFLLQIALIGGAILLALRFFRSRQQPALAGAGAPLSRQAGANAGLPRLGRPGANAANFGGSGLGGSGLGGSGLGNPGLGDSGLGASALGRAPARDEPVSEADFNAFEEALHTIQTAYGQEDLATLRTRVTPEMASYFAEGIAENARDGLVNRVSGPILLQGDLAEAWSEGDTRYAAVAMRFSVIDTTVERASGRVVSGDPETPVEATEVWTFLKRGSGPWLLSAIQQVS